SRRARRGSSPAAARARAAGRAVPPRGTRWGSSPAATRVRAARRAVPPRGTRRGSPPPAAAASFGTRSAPSARPRDGAAGLGLAARAPESDLTIDIDLRLRRCVLERHLVTTTLADFLDDMYVLPSLT